MDEKPAISMGECSGVMQSGQRLGLMMQVLFIDKVMAGACEEAPRGVELFNIRLLQELAAEGVRVTALVHPSWESYIGKGLVRLLYPAGRGRVPASARGLQLLGLVVQERFDVILLGNVANRLTAFVVWARIRRIARNCLVIAHREPSRRVLWAQRVWGRTVVVAVNGQIADHFRRAGFSQTNVYYGITGADAFRVPSSRTTSGRVKFCVVGNLENAWKGADTAIGAFRALADDIRQKSELHLVSYRQQRTFPEDNLFAYGWMDAKEIPQFLARMDVMVVPSHDEGVMRETFSQVMVQGMLSGLPIITTALPILVEKLDRGGGIVTHSMEEMALAMERLAEDEDLRQRLGQEACATATARYIWDTRHFIAQYLHS